MLTEAPPPPPTIWYWIASDDPVEFVQLRLDVTTFVHAKPQSPPWHVCCAAHGVTAPAACPHALQVWIPDPEPEHVIVPGVHTGLSGHEQLPNEQLALHVIVPYVLHDWVALGAHSPCPRHVPLSCHVPVASHVCVSVPQLLHATGFVAPGLQDPVHLPWLQT